MRATPDGMGSLLKSKKDLYEAHGNENKITVDVMVNTLIK